MTINNLRWMLAGTAAVALAGCQAQPAERQASAGTAAAQTQEVGRHPVSGLEVVPLTVRSGTRIHNFRVLVPGPEVEVPLPMVEVGREVASPGDHALARPGQRSGKANRRGHTR